MKVLHINTYDKGGAANACIRLHLSLLDQGVDSNLLILHKYTGKNIPQCVEFEKFPKKQKSLFYKIIDKVFAFFKNIFTKDNKIKASIRQLIPETVEWFSFPDTEIDITEHPLYKTADIINLHWVADFIDYSFFEKNNKPVIWTLHDMNPFTGGCHYSFSCKGFQGNCENCPQLQTIDDKSFSSKILHYKERHLQAEKRIEIVTPSSWLASEVQSSRILGNKKVHTIPYGINSEVFKIHDKSYSRKLLGLPLEKKIILFISYYSYSSNKRKGLHYLLDSLELLSDLNKETVLCMIGGDKSLIKTPFEIFHYPTVSDEIWMSVFYSACDVFILPSFEDNLPNTVLESLICGTPVIGFPAGGVIDMINNGKNGYLAEEISADALASAVRKFLSDSTVFDRNKIRDSTLKKYDSSIQAKAYLAVYKKCIK